MYLIIAADQDRQSTAIHIQCSEIYACITS